MDKKPIFKISMLGEFTISVGTNSISDQSNHSKKIWNLLEYLIIHRNKEVSQNELIELLWDDEEGSNPTGALKTLVHRARALLKSLDYKEEQIILQRRGTYSWNPEILCIVDVDEFERLHKEGSNGKDKDEKLKKYYQAFALYKGDFLPKTSFEPWIVPINAYYHSLYLKLVHELIELLEDAKEYSKMIEICSQAISIDPYDEDIHYHLILSLYRSGNQRAAIQQYSTTTDLLFSKFGVTPSDELKLLYREILKTSKHIENDLETIKSNLKEHKKENGAFFCEYEFFKDIYRLEARAAERTGNSIYLCLITILTVSGNTPELSLLNKSMDQLKVTIIDSLRLSDIFSRYSISQYILMLPTTSYETGEMVLKRIEKGFSKLNKNKRIVLNYKLQPLDPV